MTARPVWDSETAAPFDEPATDEPEAPPAREAPAVIHLPPPAAIVPAKARRHGSGRRQRVDGVFVRLLPAQKARLAEEADAARMSIPGYLLAGRLGEDETPPPRRRPPRAVGIDTEALMTALIPFNRANNNLNQLARTGNTMMLFAEEHGSDRLAAAARDLVRAVENLRDDFAPAIAAILAALGHVPEG
jgi:hypothetical protein